MFTFDLLKNISLIHNNNMKTDLQIIITSK